MSRIRQWIGRTSFIWWSGALHIDQPHPDCWQNDIGAWTVFGCLTAGNYTFVLKDSAGCQVF